MPIFPIQYGHCVYLRIYGFACNSAGVCTHILPSQYFHWFPFWNYIKSIMVIGADICKYIHIYRSAVRNTATI